MIPTENIKKYFSCHMPWSTCLYSSDHTLILRTCLPTVIQNRNNFCDIKKYMRFRISINDPHREYKKISQTLALL